MIRLSDFMSHGVVMTSISLMFRSSVVKRRFQRAKRELPRVLLTVKSFLLQDEGRHAVFEQRQAGIMGSTYESKYAHGFEDYL